MSNDPADLEPSPRELSHAIDVARDQILEFLAALPTSPTLGSPEGEQSARHFAGPPPERPADIEEVISAIFDRAVPAAINTTSPGFLAYIPGGGLPYAAVGDLIANIINRYVTVWKNAPAIAQLEASVIRWFCEMVGYSDHSSGYLATGGSLANFTAIFTARRDRLGDDLSGGTLYCSDQAHHSIQRAASLAGFPTSAVRVIPSDGVQRIELEALRKAISKDRQTGLRPFLVVGSAGTTNSGAIDDLIGLRQVAKEHQMWFHVDAAYGGFFALTAVGKRALDGIEQADSITLDPHKGLFMPYGTGCLLVADRETLLQAHAVTADYMPAMQDESNLEAVDFCNISPELSRDIRGLRVWLPIQLHGLEAFRKALEEKLDLTNWLCDQLRGIDEIEITSQPELSLFTFRVRATDRASSDTQTRALLAEINSRQRVLLTSTVIQGAFVIRVCVLSFRTRRRHIEACFEDIVASLETLRA